MRVLQLTFIVIIIVFTAACSRSKSNSPETFQVGSSRLLTDSISSFGCHTKIAPIFSFKDSIHHLYQALMLLTVSDDSLEFTLLTASDDCYTKCSGWAINNSPEGDPEIDEDGDEAYEVYEYVTAGDEYELRLRVATDMDRAKAFYRYTARDSLYCTAPPIENAMINEDIDVESQ